MSKRLTPARIERWQKDQAKACELLRGIEREASEYRVAAKGGRLSHLTNVMLSARNARQHVGDCGGLLNLLHRSETR